MAATEGSGVSPAKAVSKTPRDMPRLSASGQSPSMKARKPTAGRAKAGIGVEDAAA
jgi:hypothetical protein